MLVMFSASHYLATGNNVFDQVVIYNVWPFSNPASQKGNEYLHNSLTKGEIIWRRKILWYNNFY